MYWLKRICPACGKKELPVSPKGRRRIRICPACSKEFSEYNGMGCLTLPVILAIGFGTVFGMQLLLEPFNDYFTNIEYIVITAYVLVFILSFLIPITFLRLTVPIRLADKLERKEQPLEHKDKWPRFTVTYLVLLLVAVLSFNSCMETFFPKALRELDAARKDQLPEIRKDLLAYREDKGCFPENLNDLVPDYLDAIPVELDPEVEQEKRLYNMRYVFTDCTHANFWWQTCIGPDCSASYSLDTGEFWHDM